MTSSNIKIIAGALITTLCLMLCTSFYHLSIHTNPEEQILYVPSSTHVRGIAKQLKQHGVISNQYIFMLAAKAFQTLQKSYLQSGEYRFEKGVNILQVIEQMQQGKKIVRKIVIPEGITIEGVKQILNSAQGLIGEIEMAQHNLCECNILPDTYFYYYGETKTQLIAKMQEHQISFLRSLGLNTTDPSTQEIITLASIVEKETAIESEKARVAGVYANRLKISMPLQADPTVVYAISSKTGKLDRALTTEDLKTPSSYNTYINTGLPPTAIACPGKSSIVAALKPLHHNELYFVADGSGGHAFAQDYKTHQRNVIAYKKALKQQRER